MKLSTFYKKIPKWGEVLKDILKEELDSELPFTIIPCKDFKNVGSEIRPSDNCCGFAQIFERKIYLNYEAIEYQVRHEYEYSLQFYSDIMWDSYYIPKKKYFRTTVIEIMIHEILHLFQYAPIKYRFCNIDLFSEKEIKKREAIIEYANSFQTVYILYKYQRQLVKRLGILSLGAVTPHINAGYELLCMREEGIRLNSLKEDLKYLYFNPEDYGTITTDDVCIYRPYRKVSRDYLKAYEKAIIATTEYIKTTIKNSSEDISPEDFVAKHQKSVSDYLYKKFHEIRNTMRKVI